jgi:hypothetical protein
MVGVAQLVERRVVVADVAGSNPVAHPIAGPEKSGPARFPAQRERAAEGIARGRGHCAPPEVGTVRQPGRTCDATSPAPPRAPPAEFRRYGWTCSTAFAWAPSPRPIRTRATGMPSSSSWLMHWTQLKSQQPGGHTGTAVRPGRRSDRDGAQTGTALRPGRRSDRDSAQTGTAVSSAIISGGTVTSSNQRPPNGRCTGTI